MQWAVWFRKGTQVGWCMGQGKHAGGSLGWGRGRWAGTGSGAHDGVAWIEKYDKGLLPSCSFLTIPSSLPPSLSRNCCSVGERGIVKLAGKLSQKLKMKITAAAQQCTAASSTKAATTSPNLIPSGFVACGFWTHSVS